MVLSGSNLDEEPVVLEEAMPACCSAIEVSRFLPVRKIGVIGDDSERVFCSSQVVAPMFEGFYYC